MIEHSSETAHCQTADMNAEIENVSAESAVLEDDSSLSQPKSEISEQLERLRGATLQAISARERLPQPLFWSLFHAELENIKKKREKKRTGLKEQFSVDWL